MLPDPLSPEELLARADLAGRAFIVSVVKALDKTSPHVAKLRFEAFTKGAPRPRPGLDGWLPWKRNVVEVKMRRLKRGPDGNPIPGEWFDGYRAGDTVITHLQWNEALGAYTTLWWNAVWQTPHKR